MLKAWLILMAENLTVCACNDTGERTKPIKQIPIKYNKWLWIKYQILNVKYLFKTIYQNKILKDWKWLRLSWYWRVIGKIQCLCDLSYHVGHLILLGIQVQASGQGLRFCDLAHTRVHLLGLDRSGLAWLIFLWLRADNCLIRYWFWLSLSNLL